jgi:hypothetical protein
VPTRARIILVTSVCLAGACLAGAGFARTPEPTAGVIVHEWGTFTSVAGKDGRAIEWLALDGPADLPCFVERTVGPRKTQTATVRMETPVIYFYAPRQTTVDVRVGFRQGAITEYFPRAAVEPPRVIPTGLGQPGFESAISWRNVRILPAAAADFRSERAPNHYYAARATDAAPLEVGQDRERFLFYRGIGSFALPIAATVGASDAIAVTSLGRHEIPALMLFENRGGRIGHRVHDRATREVRLAPPNLAAPGSGADLGSTRAALERMLVAQGLYPKEAAAMTETWQDSWFEEGTRLLYVVPPAVVDAVLPLRIDPAPARLARVFVGRLELATEATLAEVRTIARTSDRASEQKYGRFLRPFAERLLAERLAPAERRRAEALMARASAAVAPKPSPCP